MPANRRQLLQRLASGALALLLPWRAAWARSERGYPRLMQGPLVGAVGPSEALIWLRASGRFPLSVRYADNPEMTGAKLSEPQGATPDTDYVVKARLTASKAGHPLFAPF